MKKMGSSMRKEHADILNEVGFGIDVNKANNYLFATVASSMMLAFRLLQSKCQKMSRKFFLTMIGPLQIPQYQKSHRY